MSQSTREAIYYQQLAGGVVRCELCAHRCRIRPGKTGICRVRRCVDGKLQTRVYGRLISAAVDPIEKKPLSHYYPGSACFSVATVGCNLRCRFCQNASISQYDGDLPPAGEPWSPLQVVDAAQRSGCRSIAFTYTEPTIALEFARDTGLLARQQGLGTVFVTNGFMTPVVVKVAAEFLDAANVDLKSARESFYRRICKARLAPVLESIAGLVAAGVWVEVTTLVVPGLNDSAEELGEIARFVASVSPSIPWHISAFHPSYQMTDRPRTPVSTLRRAYDLGRDAGLRYVYVGNVHGDRGESTYCSGCGRQLIRRYGYTLRQVSMDGDRCPDCGETVAGRGMAGAGS